MKHFEKTQYVAVLFDSVDTNLDCEHLTGNLESSIDWAIRALYRDFDIVKNCYPKEIMKRTTNYVNVYDSLNRSKYYQEVRIDKNRNITITKKLESELAQ